MDTQRRVDDPICFGPFMLVPSQQLLLEGDNPVAIGSRALAILIALCERPGEIVSKDELVAAAWPGQHVEPSNLRVHIAALRRALGQGRYITTVPLRGYCFVAPLTAQRPAAPAEDLSRQLADHVSLLDGLITRRQAVQLTPREAALLSLQIVALDAAILQVLGRTQRRAEG